MSYVYNVFHILLAYLPVISSLLQQFKDNPITQSFSGDETKAQSSSCFASHFSHSIVYSVWDKDA